MFSGPTKFRHSIFQLRSHNFIFKDVTSLFTQVVFFFQSRFSSVTILMSLQILVSSSTSSWHQVLPNPVLRRQTRQLSPEYDQCSHAFHSFLCKPAPKLRTANPESAASFAAKRVVKPSAPVAAPSVEVHSIAAAPELQPDPSSSLFQKETTPKSVTRPTEVIIGDPEFVNCQHHTVIVKPPTTPKAIIIEGESSFARESKLAPQPYLPPPESPSPAPSLSQPHILSLPLQTPTRNTSPTPKPVFETYPKTSATFVRSENILPPHQNKNFRTTLPPLSSSPKHERPIFEGQAANPSQSVIPNDNEVDNCKHSFHSFLCNPTTSSRNRRPFNNSKPKPDTSLTADSSFDDPSRLLPALASATFQKTTTKSVSLLSTSTSRPISTSTPPKDPKFFAEAAQNPVQVASLQDPKQPDICKDAFHSFLCQPIDTSRRRQKYGERYQSTIARTPVSSTSLRGDSSFIQPSKLLPNLKEPPVAEGPIEASNITSPAFLTSRLNISHQTTSILCNHSKPSPNTIRPYVIAPNTQPPIPVPKPDSTFIQPVVLANPSTPSTTIRPAHHAPELPILNIPAAQTQDVSIVKPEPGQEHNHDHRHGHDHHGIDICKDPFHSFLCAPVFPSKRKRPTGELPARFRNPVPPTLLGASSFNQPAKLLPSDDKIMTIRPPITTTKISIPPKEPPCSSKERDIQPQPAQTTNTKLIARPEHRTQYNSEDICNNVFHSACDANKSATKASKTQISLSSQSNLNGEGSFVNPSKALTSLIVNGQGTENQDSVLGYVYPKPSSIQQTETTLPIPTKPPGYIYNQPSKSLKYPTSSLRGESTFVQPSREITPINLRSQSTENQESSIAFNEFSGYNYRRPSTRLPDTTPATTTVSVTTNSISGLDTGNHETAQSYNYKKPSPVQQIVTQRHPVDGLTTYTPPGHNYPTPDKQFQYKKTLTVPFTSALISAGSNIESRHSLLSVSQNGESSKEGITQVSPYDSPYYHIFDEADNQPRPFAKIRTTTDQKPPCDHTLPKRTAIQTPESHPPPSPAEYVRGPTSAASVLAASNKVPDKCNHPFLGYVCKRSSDGQVHKSN